MGPPEFKITISIERYDGKNDWNGYVAEKRIVSKQLKISIPNPNSTNWRPEARLCQNFASLSLILSEK